MLFLLEVFSEMNYSLLGQHNAGY